MLIPTLDSTIPTHPSPVKKRDWDVHLALQLHCDRQHRTQVGYQYTRYPYRLSRPLAIDPGDSQRLYLYLMNTAPGLFAGDELKLQLHLGRDTQLHLTDQAATKAHTMTGNGQASVQFDVTVEGGATLEWVPEPLILYTDAQLAQTTHVTLHPTSRLFLTETIVPGRVAHQEFYQFRNYTSRLQVRDPEGKLIFADAMHLEGKGNRFHTSPLIRERSAITTLILVIPDGSLPELIAAIETFPLLETTLTAGYSRLPNCNGLLIRAIDDRVSHLKTYTQFVLNCVRHLTHQPPLPEIPK